MIPCHRSQLLAVYNKMPRTEYGHEVETDFPQEGMAYLEWDWKTVVFISTCTVNKQKTSILKGANLAFVSGIEKNLSITAQLY